MRSYSLTYSWAVFVDATCLQSMPGLAELTSPSFVSRSAAFAAVSYYTLAYVTQLMPVQAAAGLVITALVGGLVGVCRDKTASRKLCSCIAWQNTTRQQYQAHWLRLCTRQWHFRAACLPDAVNELTSGNQRATQGMRVHACVVRLPELQL